MQRTGLVLVHGGMHDGSCWDLTVAAIRDRAPDQPVLAVDLPGRRSVPQSPDGDSIAGRAAAVVEQIEAAGYDRVVLVGHSLAGITVPAVVELLGAARVEAVVMLAALVPRQGHSALDELPPPLGAIARATARRRDSLTLPRPVARWVFAAGLDSAGRRVFDAGLLPEKLAAPAEHVDRSGMPRTPRSWILTRRDRTLSVRAQRRFIDHLGGVDDIVEIDACHDAMTAEPGLVADLLLARLDAPDQG